MTPSAIHISGLSISYDQKRVLSNVYLDIAPGKMYGVVGPNGAGKSTLFKAILGLLTPSAGEISIMGNPVSQSQLSIAYIPQKNDVDWSFPATVEDVVMMGRYPHRKIGSFLQESDYKIALQAMQDMKIDHLRKRQISELSGGQQQRVFIARALCQEAEIFLLDEPFVGVDVTTENRIIELLQTLVQQGKTVLVIHHDLSTVPRYFTDVVLINMRIIGAGSVQEVFTPENIAATFGAQFTIFHKVNAL
jgi:ABC-type Mn2+/Zn2+ transport system ATPase subunit